MHRVFDEAFLEPSAPRGSTAPAHSVARKQERNGDWQLALLHLIGKIYEAAEDPSGWPSVTGILAAQYQGSASFCITNASAPRSGLVEYADVDAQFIRAHVQQHSTRNSTDYLWIDLPPRGDDDGSRLASFPPFGRSNVGPDFTPAPDTHHVIGGAVLRSGQTTTNLFVQRVKGIGFYTTQEIALFHAVLPHIRRAIEIGERLSRAKWSEEAALFALTAQSLGLVVVDADGCILHSSTLAAEIIHRDDGLGAVDGRLRAATAEASSRLTDAIRAAAGKRRAGDVLSLPRRRMLGQPLAVLVCPWRPSGRIAGTPGPAALVFVEDAERMQRPSAARAAALYGLTAAETRLLTALLNGEHLAAYAAAAGTSVTTAKTHLKSLFSKTGQRRQVDLVNVVLSSRIAQIAAMGGDADEPPSGSRGTRGSSSAAR